MYVYFWKLLWLWSSESLTLLGLFFLNLLLGIQWWTLSLAT